MASQKLSQRFTIFFLIGTYAVICDTLDVRLLESGKPLDKGQTTLRRYGYAHFLSVVS